MKIEIIAGAENGPVAEFFSSSNTPETDAEHAQFAMGGFTLDFCRKLERERDEARAVIRMLWERAETHLDLSDEEIERVDRSWGETAK